MTSAILRFALHLFLLAALQLLSARHLPAQIPAYPSSLPRPTGLHVKGQTDIYRYEGDRWADAARQSTAFEAWYTNNGIAVRFESPSETELIALPFDQKTLYYVSKSGVDYYFNYGSNNGEITEPAHFSFPVYFLWNFFAETTHGKMDYRTDATAHYEIIERGDQTQLQQSFARSRFDLVWLMIFKNGRYTGFQVVYNWHDRKPSVIVADEVISWSEDFPWFPVETHRIVSSTGYDPKPSEKYIINVTSINSIDPKLEVQSIIKPAAAGLDEVPFGKVYEAGSGRLRAKSTFGASPSPPSLPRSAGRVRWMIIIGGVVLVGAGVILSLRRIQRV